MKALNYVGGPEEKRRLESHIHRLREEIALAKQRGAGLQAAINSREKTLARLEAQLLLTSAAGQTATSVAG